MIYEFILNIFVASYNIMSTTISRVITAQDVNNERIIKNVGYKCCIMLHFSFADSTIAVVPKSAVFI